MLLEPIPPEGVFTYIFLGILILWSIVMLLIGKYGQKDVVEKKS